MRHGLSSSHVLQHKYNAVHKASVLMGSAITSLLWFDIKPFPRWVRGLLDLPQIAQSLQYE